MHLIMRKFDETLALKSSKTVIEKLYEYMDNTFTVAEDYKTFVNRVEKEVKDSKTLIENQTKMLELLKETLY